MSTNIVVAAFGEFREVRTRALYKWDYGQILRFEGLNLPDTYIVHFSNDKVGGESVTMIGNADGVEIPNECLTTGQPVYAWVYLNAGADDGETVYSVIIPVKARPRPCEDVPTPVQQGAIEQAIAALNTGVAAAQEAAQDAEQIATDLGDFDSAMRAVTAAKEEAAGSAANASTAAGEAADSAAEAAEILENMRTEGAAQISAIDAKGREVLESIPEEYADLSADVVELKSQIEKIDTVVFTEKNLIDTSNYVPDKTSNAPTPNGDGTWTFGNTGYGTTIWKSLGEVPAGDYVLQGIESYGRTFVTTNTLYSGVLAENRTGSDITFTNPTSQILYLGVRIDRTPAETHVFYPHINVKESNVIEKNQGSENAGKALIVDADGNVVPGDVSIDIDDTLTQAGAAADAKVVGDKIDGLESVFSDVVRTIHHVIPVSGELDTTVYAYMGVIIPTGRGAKITISTDMPYRADAVGVFYNDEALYTSINSTSTGQRFYDGPVTIEIPDSNTYINTVRVQLGHIAATSGSVDITVTFNDGKEANGLNNILPYKIGANLIDPSYLYRHVGIEGENNYIVKLSSDRSVGWVPIHDEEAVTFNKTISNMVVTDDLFDGTYDYALVVKDQTRITNNTGKDAYVLFDVATSAMTDLIAVVGEYPYDYKPYSPIGGYVENEPDRTYGTISMYYPDEGQRARQIDSTQMSNRLRFVHISDTHQSGQNPLRYADQFTDLSGAAFLTLTGDMVNNSIANDFAITAAQINAMEKPCYICMGNHDVWGDTNPTQRYTKYFNQIAEHNGLPENVSYYAVDFTSEHVKCIWLDMYELSTDTPSHVMSGTQIAWFFSQLDDAISKSYHVCVFMHEYIGPNDDVIREFNDWDGVNGYDSALKWILDTVAAFQSNGSVSFTHNGDSYTHTFSGNGVFVAYFNGHAHWDRTGWIKDYNQFNVTVTRAVVTSEGGTMTGEKLGCAYNYVAVDASKRKLSVMRVGTNKTIWGVDRLAFSIQY